ncbi:helix-turn-helix transcriptional regulator [Microbispora corallina]|uniref:Transcriptional regulator n=1 Tax=Microbispora corallina TaxID=83302 RepID=A0ABQ4G163_9ACTN|nr:helix-turn-helix transcriptional regulator [Microbispora corallina]GIH40816.1 transcriptional regulator [Microbispora corallina]
MEVLADLLRALRTTAPLDALARLPRPGRPRGLRRDEVAMLTGLDPEYYARLERGEVAEPPDWVLDVLARVFNLDADAVDRMHRLAHPAVRRRVPPVVQQTVDNWHRAPVFAVNRRLDVLASNRLARVLFDGMDHTDNLMRHAFLEPGAQGFFRNWEREACSKVAHLVAANGDDADAPEVRDLVDQLCSESQEFRRMWGRRDAEVDEFKHMYHPEVGDMDLRHDTLSVGGAPDVLLYVCHADPGSAAEEALTLLGILAAGEP